MNLSDFGIYRLDTVDDVPVFLDWLVSTLESGQTIAIDTETGSVNDLWVPRPFPGTGFCRLWQVGTATEGWAIDCVQWHGLVHEAMSRVAGARNVVAMANAKYDQHVFAKEGWPLVPWHRVDDVVVMHRLSRSWEQRHGLKPAAVAEFGEWAGAGQRALKDLMQDNGWAWDTVPTDSIEYFGYGVMDVCLTVMLREVLIKEQTWWYEVESEYQRLTFEMERRGLLVDMERLAYAESVWRADVERCKEELAIYGFDRPGSNKAVIAAFEQLGFEPQDFSEKTGDPVYNRMVLESLQSAGEPMASAAKHLIEYRRASKWLSVYGTALRNSIYENDTVHFSVSTMEARTGRSSIKKPGPPLQTIPKHPTPRNCFRARRGHKLWAVDFSSQEIRVQAGLSLDPAMIAFFEGEDNDYHQYVADLAGIPRKAAKVVNYARAYGAGVAKLAQSAGVGEDDMTVYLGQIDAAFPRAIEWKDEVTKLAVSRIEEVGYPYVDLPYGRRAALIEGKEFTTAANTIIQGHGADVLKLAAVRISQAGYEGAMRLPVHDEFLLELPEGDTTSAFEIAGLMEDHLLPVPLTCDVTGPLDRWGQAHEREQP